MSTDTPYRESAVPPAEPPPPPDVRRVRQRRRRRIGYGGLACWLGVIGVCGAIWGGAGIDRALIVSVAVASAGLIVGLLACGIEMWADPL